MYVSFLLPIFVSISVFSSSQSLPFSLSLFHSLSHSRSHRRKHVSAVLNVRGMVQQAERQEILAVVRDFETNSDMPRDHALFSEIAVATDMPCLGLVLIRFALTVSSWVSSARPHRRNTNRSSNHKEDDANQHVIQVNQ